MAVGQQIPGEEGDEHQGHQKVMRNFSLIVR